MNNKPVTSNNARATSAKILNRVLEEGQSLSAVLLTIANNKDRALIQEICFGVLRVMPQLDFFINKLMAKPLKGKNRLFHYLLMVGLYQILYTRVPPHAAVAETVNAVKVLNKNQFNGVINGVLRQFQRQQTELLAEYQKQNNQTLHPSWFVKRIQQAYPEQWQSIITANNQKPPMWLRVNVLHHTAEQYQSLLAQIDIAAECHSTLPGALRLLSPVPVTSLPGFLEGWVTVQDLSAQYAAHLLAPENRETILDLCAAPGGKTTHILELAPNAQVLAIDHDKQRLQRVYENLTRLNQQAEVKVGDGRFPEQWCAGMSFNRILLDAPCSATGVIRRHPDIKWLRRDSDIAELAQLQYEILTNIWPYLKTGGRLVYATCSVLPDENKLQIERFLAETPNAKLEGEMQQHLPTIEGGDGFFYGTLVKG